MSGIRKLKDNVKETRKKQEQDGTKVHLNDTKK